jgi:PPOX class probable F420-dependent enzyme
MALTPEEIAAFLQEPHVAVLATVRPDGRPHAVPIWYEYDAGEVVFHMGPTSVRYRNLLQNDNATLCVDTKTSPYKAVILEGKVELHEGQDDERTARMAVQYLGERAGRRYAESMKGERVVIGRLRPLHTISWDYGRREDP